MLKRRSTWFGGSGALLLVLSLSGVVAGATVLTAVTAPAPVVEPEVVDTTATFEDLDGNGVDDDCQEAVVADPEAAAAAEAAVDADGDGVISTTEAAQSERTGGTNCNHGGYVSIVAHENGDTCGVEPTDDETVEPTEDETAELIVSAPDATETEVEACDEAAEEVVEPDACVIVAAPEREPVLEPSPNDHGVWVSTVAGSLATGGKNCNHGGAVSEAAKKDKEAATAAREASKAARAEAREAKKAERDAAREARTAERQSTKAAKPAKTHGKSH